MGRRCAALIEQERPQLVVPEIEAIATDVLAAIEREGLAEVIPTARAVQLTMNREGIRRLAAEELALPTSPYRFANSQEELRRGDRNDARHRLPVRREARDVVVGQGPDRRARRPQRSRPRGSMRESAARVRGSRVIVEGFIDFDYEITLLTVRACDETGTVHTHFCAPVGHVQVNGDYVESWQPQPMSPRALDRSRDIAARVTTALGGRGIFGVELFVKGDDVWFSEVSPRPHDTGMVTMCTQAQSEFELHARAILGLPVDVRQTAPGASAVIYGGIDARGIHYDDISRTRLAYRTPTCACSASPRRTSAGEWASRSRQRPTSTRRANARRSARGASSLAPDGRGRNGPRHPGAVARRPGSRAHRRPRRIAAKRTS